MSNLEPGKASSNTGEKDVFVRAAETLAVLTVIGLLLTTAWGNAWAMALFSLIVIVSLLIRHFFFRSVGSVRSVIIVLAGMAIAVTIAWLMTR